jgi:hypothetical protein
MSNWNSKKENIYEKNQTDNEVKEILAQVEIEIANMDLSKVPDLKDLDPKLWSFMKKYGYKEPPSDLKEQFLKIMREEKNKVEKKTIFTRINPQVIQQMISPQLRLVGGLASIILLIGSIAFLSFLYNSSYSNNSSNSVLISKNSTPINTTPIIKGERSNSQNNTLQAIKTLYIETKQNRKEVNKLISLVFEKLNRDNPLESRLSIVSDKNVDHDAILRISVNQKIVNVEVVNVRTIPNISLWAKKYPLTDLDTLSSIISKDFMDVIQC